MQVKTYYQTLKGKCTLDPPPAVVDRTEDGRKSSSQPQLNVQRASSVTHTFNFFAVPAPSVVPLGLSLLRKHS